MKKAIGVMIFICMFFVLANFAQASVLTFEDWSNLGVNLGGNMSWNNAGGGHLFCQSWDDNDSVSFSTPTYLNDFRMNARPWQDYNVGEDIGYIDIAAFDSIGTQLWSSTVDLRNYTTWDNWLTVSIERDAVSSIVFYAPGMAPHYNGFWPSIDNMRINEGNVTPEPASMLLFGIGGVALAAFKRKKKIS